MSAKWRYWYRTDCEPGWAGTDAGDRASDSSANKSADNVPLGKSAIVFAVDLCELGIVEGFDVDDPLGRRVGGNRVNRKTSGGW